MWREYTSHFTRSSSKQFGLICEDCGSPRRARIVGATSDSSPSRRAKPGAVRIAGTGFVVCAVCGLIPSSWRSFSAFPWSAMIRHTPPARATASTTRPRHASVVSTASTTAGITPVWPDHVGVREVDDDEAQASFVDRRNDLVGDFGGRHLRLLVIARDVARRVDEDPLLLVEWLLATAVEEVRHVRVLLRLGGVELADPVLAQHLGERPLDDVLGERDGEREVVAVARHRREVDAELAELLGELSATVRAEVEEDRRVGRRDRAAAGPRSRSAR